MELYTSKILDVVPQSGELVTFYVSTPEGVHWNSGAHMHVGLPGFRDGDKPNKALVRHMSICTRECDGRVGFTTRICAEPSEFKGRLKAMKAGDEVTLFKIGNRLALSSDRDNVLITQGVGLAAVYPLLMDLSEGKLSASVSLLQIQRPEEALFSEGLEALRRKAEQGNIVFSEKSVSKRGDFYQELDALIRSHGAKALYTIIGGEGFLKGVLGTLAEHGIGRDSVQLDKGAEKAELFLSILG